MNKPESSEQNISLKEMLKNLQQPEYPQSLDAVILNTIKQQIAQEQQIASQTVSPDVHSALQYIQQLELSPQALDIIQQQLTHHISKQNVSDANSMQPVNQAELTERQSKEGDISV